MAIWDDVLSETDKKVLAKGGWGKRRGFGKKPAVLVIDPQYNYVGADVPILEAMDEFPAACGEIAWKAIRKIKKLLTVAREKNVPIIYTKVEVKKGELKYDAFAKKTKRERETFFVGHKGTEFVEEVAPREGDVVVGKQFASAFFGTPLISYLNGLRVDTLIITGGTTSGCVRATAIDGVGYNFNVTVVQDCVFDRIQGSHRINLYDLWMKYCDVITSEEVLSYLKSI